MKKLLSCVLVVLTAVSLLCAPDSAVASEKDEPTAAPPVVVAKIGSYTITREELEKQFMTALRPDDYDYYDAETEPATVRGTLEKMVAEKAMVIEARAKGGLNDERSQRVVKQYRGRRLANLLGQRHLKDKVTASESEIAAKMKDDPKLDKVRAEAMVKSDKSRTLWNKYYSEITTRLNVKKLSENYPVVAAAHHRLLNRPRRARSVGFIRGYQIEEDLTPEEKKTVLATFDGGQITLEDWFRTLSDNISPPNRPRDMKDMKVLERLLDSTLQIPLLVAEAESLGLDKDEDLLKQVKGYEDMMLLNNTRNAQYKNVKEPTAEEIRAYFDKNKEKFGTSESVKIDAIWCDDLAKARKAKAELDEGKDFEQVKQEHSLQKQGKPYNIYPSSEGLFWKEISAGDPNEIVGPMKGFYGPGVKWRIVKILEKKPGEMKEYDDNMGRRAKDRIMSEQRKALVAAYSRELLQKYTYNIYDDKIKDIDPLDIP